MEFSPSKKIPLADCLSRLIPTIREPLEETVMASMSSEINVKNVLYNTVKEQSVRSYVYWYGKNKKIENMVKTCKNCVGGQSATCEIQSLAKDR